MATKDVTVRIDDTLNFIANTPLVNANTRAAAHAFAQAFINARYPPGNAALPAYIAFSNRMALGFHMRSDPNQRRHMVRAIYMLWSAMNNANGAFVIPVQDAAHINQASADRLLASVMRKARIMHQVGGGNTSGLRRVLTEAQNDPMGFLALNKIFVAGSPYRDPGATDQNVVACYFLYEPARDRYEFRVRVPTPNSRQIQVESVCAVHWVDTQAGPGPHAIATANFNNIRGVELSGAHMMVTTQFTGCSFCMKEDGGHMYCAHLSPAVPAHAFNTNSAALGPRVMATGDFGNAPGGGAFHVYARNMGTHGFPGGYDLGPEAGNTFYMSIIGFPGGTSYNIYSQVTRADRIAGHHQIYP